MGLWVATAPGLAGHGWTLIWFVLVCMGGKKREDCSGVGGLLGFNL